MPTFDLWLGTASSKEAFDAFFEETYADDDAPISAFAASQGVSFYDHDFLERIFGTFDSVEDVLKKLSFSDSFADAVLDADLPEHFNCVVVLFSEEISSPASASRDGLELGYVGRFEYDPRAETLGISEIQAAIYLHLLDGRQIDFEGALTDCIRVDMRGLMIGRLSPHGRSLDLSPLVPEIADSQLRIAHYQEMWELRDFGNNGLSRLGSDSFDNERSLPWPGITFSVGEVRFLWSDQPTRD